MHIAAYSLLHEKNVIVIDEGIACVYSDKTHNALLLPFLQLSNIITVF